jgi:hypothetical protein
VAVKLFNCLEIPNPSKKMSTQTLTGPYSLRQRLYNATQQASESLEKMTFEQRREAGRKAHLRFTTKNAC